MEGKKTDSKERIKDLDGVVVTQAKQSNDLPSPSGLVNRAEQRTMDQKKVSSPVHRIKISLELESFDTHEDNPCNFINLKISTKPKQDNDPIREFQVIKKEETAEDAVLKSEHGAIASIRAVTWLDINDLPRPVIEINVFYANIAYCEPLINIIRLISEGNSPPAQTTMKYELLRVCTFKSYPRGNKPFLTRFAKAGFYYASDQDGVVCFCCGIRRYGWSGDEEPDTVHKRINPRCKFYMKNEENNIAPLSDGPLRQNVAALVEIPECDYVLDDSEDVNNDEVTPQEAMEREGNN